MSIQILGIREYFSKKTNRMEKAERFFERGWRAPSVEDLLADPDHYLREIPQEERFNLYFTTAHCLEEPGRHLERQDIIPFDIDGIDKTKITETWHAACAALGITPSKNGAIFSGNGIWILVKAHEPILSEEYFENNRQFYKELCLKINLRLEALGLAGKADTTCWSAARLARMPNTKNIKKDKDPAEAYILNSAIEDEGFNFVAKSGVPILTKEDQLDKNFMRGYPSPDAREILSDRGCRFLSWAKNNPNQVNENQWYGMLSILEWMPDGRALSHEFSRGYKNYSFEETERKADQAKTNAGPRTCKNICGMWDGCGKCPHFNKVTSPVQIRGEDFIVTEKTGFWSFKETKDGRVTVNKPEVADLVKFYKRNFEFVSVPESQQHFVYNGKHWTEVHTSKLQIYAKDHFNPSVNSSYYNEFETNVLLTNAVPRDWFQTTTAGRFNLLNGVYDMTENKLLPHSKDFGFTYVLPYEYDQDADCPTFKKFMKDITLDREDLVRVLLEYAGYALSNDECWLQKALFLYGTGSNGKSTFADVMRMVAGSGNCSNQRLERVGNPTVNSMIEGKLFNISEETSGTGFFDSQDFKEIVAGGHMAIKRLYKNPYEVVNRTKFVALCNELPQALDNSHGFYRRLILVPFDARFETGRKDPFILKKFEKELAGIFNMIVRYYMDLKNRGSAYVSGGSTDLYNKYVQESDVASAWIQDTMEIVPNSSKDKWVSMTDVYQEYVTNCQYDWGVKPVSAVRFWRKVDATLGIDNFRIKANVRKNGKQIRVLRDVVRKEVNEEEF